jgi:hypothetical protein
MKVCTSICMDRESLRSTDPCSYSQEVYGYLIAWVLTNMLGDVMFQIADHLQSEHSCHNGYYYYYLGVRWHGHIHTIPATWNVEIWDWEVWGLTPALAYPLAYSTSKNMHRKEGWWCDLRGRLPDLQRWIPEFNPCHLLFHAATQKQDIGPPVF